MENIPGFNIYSNRNIGEKPKPVGQSPDYEKWYQEGTLAYSKDDHNAAKKYFKKAYDLARDKQLPDYKLAKYRQPYFRLLAQGAEEGRTKCVTKEQRAALDKATALREEGLALYIKAKFTDNTDETMKYLERSEEKYRNALAHLEKLPFCREFYTCVNNIDKISSQLRRT